jgi:hypothetical protein
MASGKGAAPVLLEELRPAGSEDDSRSSWADVYFRRMRLSADEVQYISRKIVKTLVAEQKLEVDSETRVEENIAKVIIEELQIEDRLNDEVREVLLEHSSQMERSDITYTEMFKKVKRELAKKKGIVL